MARAVYGRWGATADKKNLGLGVVVHSAQISIIIYYTELQTYRSL